MIPVVSVMSRLGWGACAVLALAGGVGLASCWPALSAAFSKTPPARTDAPDPKAAEALHAQGLKAQVASAKGRSLFFVPPRPPPPPTPRPKEDHTPPPPAPDPKPTRYGGPSIQALVTGTVWFSDGKKAEIGETIGSGSSAVTVLAADTPYAVKLRWKEQDWDVAMFDRDNAVFPSERPVGKAEDKKVEEPKKPEEPKADAKKPEDPKSADPKPGEPKPGDPKVGDPKPADPKPDAPAAADPKADPKSGPSKADEPKSDSSATPNHADAKPAARL